MVTIEEAKQSWEEIRHSSLPGYLQTDIDVLDEYFKGVLSKPLPPAPLAPKRCEELAQVWGTDEYKCPKCDVMWDRDEERPDCRI